jgi:hypothetical protein
MTEVNVWKDVPGDEPHWDKELLREEYGFSSYEKFIEKWVEPRKEKDDTQK